MTPRWWPSWLSGRAAVHASLLAALLLSFPALFIGFFGDDFLHLAALAGKPVPGGPWDLFVFADGHPEHLWPLIRQGPMPWWTLPDVHLAFWRPLSVALSHLDQLVFGTWAPGHHLHSIAWYLAVVAAAGLVLRRVLPDASGALALFLFAVAPAHFVPAAWIANRNALVCAAFGFVALWAHLRWREDGWRWGPLVSLGALVLALAGGEAGLSVLPFFAAYELLAGTGTRFRRLVALAPAVVLSVGYVLVHHLLGYGAHGSGIYLDPRHEPLTWLAEAPGRALGLVGAELFGSPVDLWIALPWVRVPLALVGLASIAALAVVLREAWPSLEAKEKSALAWLSLGAVGALAPLVSTFPLGRLLLVPSLGGAAVVGVVLRAWWRDRACRSRVAAVVCVLLALSHLALAPLHWYGEAALVGLAGRWSERMAESVDVDDATVGATRVVTLTAPDPMTGIYPFIIRSVRGHPQPRATWMLSLAVSAHRLARPTERRLELEVLDGAMLEGVFETLFRAPSLAPKPGWSVALDGMTVTVLEADPRGLPKKVAFEFDVPLEDPSLRFLAWQDGALRRATLPKVGEVVELPRHLGLAAFERPEGAPLW